MEPRKFTVKRKLSEVIVRVVGTYESDGHTYWRCKLRKDSAIVTASMLEEQAKNIIKTQIRCGHELPTFNLSQIAPIDRSICQAEQKMFVTIHT
jgi:hypothetical protein